MLCCALQHVLLLTYLLTYHIIPSDLNPNDVVKAVEVVEVVAMMLKQIIEHRTCVSWLMNVGQYVQLWLLKRKEYDGSVRQFFWGGALVFELCQLLCYDMIHC
jgi:hypothetical protein